MQTSPVANLWLRTIAGAGVMAIVASLSASGGGGQWLERTPGLSRTPGWPARSQRSCSQNIGR